MRICDYKSATQHVDKLDAAMKADLQKVHIVKELSAQLDSVNRSLSQPNLQRKERSALSEKKVQLEEQFRAVTGLDPHVAPADFVDKLHLALPPLDGEWLPKSAVYALVDLMTVMLGRPKGVFKECGRRIQSGLNLIHGEPWCSFKDGFTIFYFLYFCNSCLIGCQLHYQSISISPLELALGLDVCPLKFSTYYSLHIAHSLHISVLLCIPYTNFILTVLLLYHVQMNC